MYNYIAAHRRPISEETCNAVRELKYKIDNEVYREIFARAKGSTGTFASGIHDGYYIAAVQVCMKAFNDILMMVPS